MKKIICTASPSSVGCTFIDWSIHFLSGADRFYSVKDHDWIPLSSNPINKINAHGHKKNHPSGLANTQNYVELFQNTPGQIFSFYPFPLYADSACRSLGYDPPKLLKADLTKKIQVKQQEDWADTINYCLGQDVKVIYVDIDQKNILYTKVARSLDRLFFEDRRPQTIQEVSEHIDDLFFQNKFNEWQQQGLVNIWDKREFLALCRRPFENYFENWSFDRTQPHLSINSSSLWYNGQHTIKKIIKFCGLTIDEQRWKSWLSIYLEWQQIQFEILEFIFNCQHIVDAIVNNWYYELDDLTFEQEVIIQHCLIYQHGLNLQTWQLEKFPANAQDLHELLEPNIHQIESIY